VRGFKPDVTIDHPTELKIGGTRIGLFLCGVETPDAMFMNCRTWVLFVGDFIMPYLGAPSSRRRSAGAVRCDRHRRRETPSISFAWPRAAHSEFRVPGMLAQLKTDLIWLRERIGVRSAAAMRMP
jgi:hypothetical protein